MKISKQTLKNLKRSKVMRKLALVCVILAGVVSIVNAQMTGDRPSELIFECVAKGDEQACKSLIDDGFIGEAYDCEKIGMCNLGVIANMNIGNKDRAIPYLEKLINLNDSQRKQDFVFMMMTALGVNEKEALEFQEGAYIDLLEYYSAKNKSLGGNNREVMERLVLLSYIACGKATHKQVLSYACALASLFSNLANNYHNAFTFAKKGCETNVKREEAYDAGVSQSNCTLVGVLYEGGKGVRQDYTKAAEYYKKGCDLGYAMPCEELGRLYMQGKGVPRNRSSAKRLFGKACDLGEQKACNRYRELNQAGVQ